MTSFLVGAILWFNGMCENKAGTIKLRFRDDHDIWNWTPLVTRCHLPESKSWKKPGLQTKGNVNMAEWTISTPQQPDPCITHHIYTLQSYRYIYEVRLFELAVIGTILWKTTLSERYQHQQPAHVKFDCSS